jgi:Flp pilus assembly protein TadD/glutathione synthase/RimK-type ligase-like ATP-grasp enzyme
MTDAIPPLLAEALTHHQAGRRDEAITRYRAILDITPGQPDTLRLLGVLLGDGSAVDGAEIDEAVQLLSRYHELVPGDALACYSLGMLHHRQGRRDQAIGLLHQAVLLKRDFSQSYQALGVALHEAGRLEEAGVAFDCAQVLAPTNAILCSNIGELRFTQKQPDAALEQFDRAVALDPSLVEAWCNKGIALTDLDRPDEAVAALSTALALQPDHIQAHLRMALALDALRRPEEAAKHRHEAARLRRVLVEPCTGPKVEARILFLCGSGRGDVPIEYIFDRSRFDRTLVFLTSPGAGPAPGSPFDDIAPYDVAFCTIADADRGTDDLDRAAALPIAMLNRPDRVAATRRDRLPELASGIPGLAVPPTWRVDREDLPRYLEHVVTQPLLIRPVGSHGGTDLALIREASELSEFLKPLPYRTFYLTEFRDYRSSDGFYRKYRFIFVDRQVYAYHLAIMDDWKVHYWRTDMARQEWMKREEEAFLADWTVVFPRGAKETLATLAQRLDLDYGGIDCGLTPNGEIVLFEANAAMLVHLDDDPEDFAYKHRYVPPIRAAVSTMILSRILK